MFNMTLLELEGYQAFHDKKWRHDCPYPAESTEAKEWLSGFDEACRGPSHD